MSETEVVALEIGKPVVELWSMYSHEYKEGIKSGGTRVPGHKKLDKLPRGTRPLIG